MSITKHFTATTIIVCEKKALFHLHKKLGLLLPPGGHIEQDEIPSEAALREVKEEAGMDVVLYEPEQPMDLKGKTKQLLSPMHVMLENIYENTDKFHQHIDLIYYARSNSFEVDPQNSEVQELKWLTSEEIKSFSNIPADTKIMALEAIELLGV